MLEHAQGLLDDVEAVFGEVSDEKYPEGSGAPLSGAGTAVGFPPPLWARVHCFVHHTSLHISDHLRMRKLSCATRWRCEGSD